MSIEADHLRLSMHASRLRPARTRVSLSGPAEPAVRESPTGSAYLFTYRDGLSHENRLLAFLCSPASHTGSPPTACEVAVSAHRPAQDTLRRVRLSAADSSSSSRDTGRHAAAERRVPAQSNSYRQLSLSPVGHSHRNRSPMRSAPHAPRAPPVAPLGVYSSSRAEAALSARALTLARHYRSQSKEAGGRGRQTSASKESASASNAPSARDTLRLPSSVPLRWQLDARERERQTQSRPLTSNALSSSSTRQTSGLAALHTKDFYEATRELRGTDVPDTRTARSNASQLASRPQPEGVSAVQRPNSSASHSPERASIQLERALSSTLRSCSRADDSRSDAGPASQRSEQRLGAASRVRDNQTSRSFYEPNTVRPPESGTQPVFVSVNTTPVLRNASALAAHASFDSQQPLDMLSKQPLLFRAFPANPLLAFESQGVLNTRAVDRERERVAPLRRAAISAGALERRATPRISDSVSELVSSRDVDRDARALWEQMRHTEAESARQAPAPGKGILKLKKSCSLLALERLDAEALELPLVGLSEPPPADDELCPACDSADDSAPLADPQQRPTEELSPDDVRISLRPNCSRRPFEMRIADTYGEHSKCVNLLSETFTCSFGSGCAKGAHICSRAIRIPELCLCRESHAHVYSNTPSVCIRHLRSNRQPRTRRRCASPRRIRPLTSVSSLTRLHARTCHECLNRVC